MSGEKPKVVVNKEEQEPKVDDLFGKISPSFNFTKKESAQEDVPVIKVEKPAEPEPKVAVTEQKPTLKPVKEEPVIKEPVIEEKPKIEPELTPEIQASHLQKDQAERLEKNLEIVQKSEKIDDQGAIRNIEDIIAR